MTLDELYKVCVPGLGIKVVNIDTEEILMFRYSPDDHKQFADLPIHGLYPEPYINSIRLVVYAVGKDIERLKGGAK